MTRHCRTRVNVSRRGARVSKDKKGTGICEYACLGDLGVTAIT